MRSMIASLCCVALAACAPPPAPFTAPAAVTAPAVVDVPAPTVGSDATAKATDTPSAAAGPFAPLLSVGSSWTYDVAYTAEHWDDQDPLANAQGTVRQERHGKMTCRVASVSTLGTAQVSELSCEDGGMGAHVHNPGPGGYYLLNAAGLYRLDGPPSEGDAESPDARQRVLARQPKEGVRTRQDGDFGERTDITFASGDWCVSKSWWGGDESGWSLCLHAERGITSGSAFFAGGSSHEVTYGRTN